VALQFVRDTSDGVRINPLVASMSRDGETPSDGNTETDGATQDNGIEYRLLAKIAELERRLYARDLEDTCGE
jgi:hypothetical protein